MHDSETMENHSNEVEFSCIRQDETVNLVLWSTSRYLTQFVYQSTQVNLLELGGSQRLSVLPLKWPWASIESIKEITVLADSS